MSRVVLRGKAACARLLRLLADHIEWGDLAAPPTVVPAPHLGEWAVRIAVDYDLAEELPGVVPDPADDEETEP